MKNSISAFRKAKADFIEPLTAADSQSVYNVPQLCGGKMPTRRFAGTQSKAPKTPDMQAIERLHQADVTETLSGDPKALADLFTDDAVLLQPDSPALVGKQAILSANQKNKAEHPSSKVLAYKPEIHDLQISDGWAFEWSSFEASYTESENEQPKSFHAKALRVLKRERNGEWKFSRVMWNSAP